MEQTETKLKMESEILSLKREFKYATENLARLKTYTAEIIATKERITREINERNDNLTKVLNEISDQKLHWGLERQKQLEEVNGKMEEADKIISKKDELNLQEIKLKEIEENTTKIRDEARQLELKLKAENTLLDVKRREIEDERDVLEQEKKDFAVVKQNFKNKLAELVQIYG